MIPCPTCSEPITDEGHHAMTAPLGPDPLEPIFQKFARRFRFSADDGKTFMPTHNRGRQTVK